MQQSHNALYLFDKDIAPRASLLAISLIRPYLSEKKGHEAALSQYNFMHNQQTLEDFLDSYGGKTDIDRIVSPIIVSANNHSILVCRTESKTWAVLDPNDLPGRSFESSTELSGYIFKALNTEYEDLSRKTFFYISMDILCDKNDFPAVSRIIENNKVISSENHMKILSFFSRNDPDKNKKILFHAVCYFDNETTDFICDRPGEFHGAIHYTSKSGMSALGAATAAGNLYAVKKISALIKSENPSIYAELLTDQSVYYAVQNGQTGILSFLYREICAGEEEAEKKMSRSCLACAIMHENSRMISFILDTMRVSPDRFFLVSILKNAIREKKYNSVKILYERFHDIFSGENMIFYAVHSDNYPVISYLISIGENVDCLNASGSTALHIAAESGKKECVMSLILNNARLDIVDSENALPIEAAILSNNAEVCIILAAHGSALPSDSWPITENFRLLRQVASDLGISLDLPAVSSPAYDSVYPLIEKCYRMVADKFNEREVTLFLTRNVAEILHGTEYNEEKYSIEIKNDTSEEKPVIEKEKSDFLLFCELQLSKLNCALDEIDLNTISILEIRRDFERLSRLTHERNRGADKILHDAAALWYQLPDQYHFSQSTSSFFSPLSFVQKVETILSECQKRTEKIPSISHSSEGKLTGTGGGKGAK